MSQIRIPKSTLLRGKRYCMFFRMPGNQLITGLEARHGNLYVSSATEVVRIGPGDEMSASTIGLILMGILLVFAVAWIPMGAFIAKRTKLGRAQAWTDEAEHWKKAAEVYRMGKMLPPSEQFMRDRWPDLREPTHRVKAYREYQNVQLGKVYPYGTAFGHINGKEVAILPPEEESDSERARR